MAEILLERKAEAVKRAVEAMNQLDPDRKFDKDTRLKESDAPYKPEFLRFCRELSIQGSCEFFRLSGFAHDDLELEYYRKAMEKETKTKDFESASFEDAWKEGEADAIDIIQAIAMQEEHRNKIEEKRKIILEGKWMDLSEIKGANRYTRKWLTRSFREPGEEDENFALENTRIAAMIQKDGRRLYAIEKDGVLLCYESLPGVGSFIANEEEEKHIRREAWGEEIPFCRVR